MLAIYCRISRLKEDGKDRSIDDQKQLGIEKAKELNLPYKFYVDEGISGAGDTLEERPEITTLLRDVVAKHVTAVFVIDESRLSRNPRTKYLITDVFKEYNVITYSAIDGKIDYSNLDDEFISEIKGVIHKRQVSEQKFKIKSVLKSNAKNGRAHGILPYGYCKDASGFIKIDDEEAKIIRLIYQLSLEGKGTSKIAEILNLKEVPTRYNIISKGTITVRNKDSGKLTTRSKNEITWAGNTIRNIIKNTFYKGERKFSNEIYRSPIIIKPDYWNAVNHNLKNNSNTSGKQTNHLYLLKGLMECEKCGRNMYGRTRSNKKDNYYMCSSKRFKNLNCGNRSINIDRIEYFIWMEILKEDGFKKYLIENLDNPGVKEKIKIVSSNIKIIQNEIIKFKQEKQKAIQFAIKGLIAESDIKGEIERISERIKDSEVKLFGLNDELQYLESNLKTENQINIDFKSIIEKADFNTKRNFLKKYIKRININWIASNRRYYVRINFHNLPKSITYILDWKCNFVEIFNPLDSVINKTISKF